MKRPLTLTGAILGLCGSAIAAIFAVISLVGFINLYNWTGAYGYGGEIYLSLIILFALISALYIVTAILSGIAIPCWKKDKTGYKKKKGLLITAIVFFFTAALISFFTADVFMIILGLVCIAAAVLFIVDVARESKKGVPVQPQVVVATQPQVQTTIAQPQAPAPVAPEQKQVVDKVAAADEFSQKMAKITALKNQGILTEEEFSEIKKSYIKEYIG